MARYERGYARGERLAELLRRILADELIRIGDETLELVAITGVKTDRDLNFATVYFSTLNLDPGEESEIAETLAAYRRRFGEAIGSESRLRRVPRLSFSPDPAMHSGARVEAVLRGMGEGGSPQPLDAGDPAAPPQQGPEQVEAVEAPPADGGIVREVPKDGFAVVDKEAGCTSHDVVVKARQLLGTRRVGHSGTLDPDATGVLVLGFGKATRLLRFLTDLGKEYEASVLFGVQTTTGDASGELCGQWDMSALGREEASESAGKFIGQISQVPPMVSALKVEGKRLHELAREGRTVERKARTVSVSRFDVLDFEPGERPQARIQVACSSGTYIRTLAEDWGKSLGGGAHLLSLRRTAVGSFSIAEGRPLDSLELLPPAEGLRDYPAIRVDEETARKVSHGRHLPAELAPVRSKSPFAVLSSDGELLAVYELIEGRLKPAVVLAASN